MAEGQKSIKITLKKSTIGQKPSKVRTVSALGLKKIGACKVYSDNPSVRGMARAVSHLVTIEEL